MILLIGPFIGNIRSEIKEFLPFVRWLYELREIKKIYVSSHFNRRFLYSFIEDKYFIPIYKNLSRDELSQKGSIHNFIDVKQYKFIQKQVRNKINEIEQCGISQIKTLNVPYKKNSTISLNNKFFTSLPFERFDEDEWLFIPDKFSNYNFLNLIKENFKLKIIGDMHCHFSEDNEILFKKDYTENGYKSILKRINLCKGIISPISIWTYIANLQGKKVISWGKYISQYKKNSLYNFGNTKSKILYMDKTLKESILLKFIERNMGE